jgi:hypothetical protein
MDEIEFLLKMLDIGDRLLIPATEHVQEMPVAYWDDGNWEDAWMILRKSVFFVN